MIRKLLSGLLFFCFNLGMAQILQLSGKVADENGEPLPFANIYLENTSIGTYSDINGHYQIAIETEGTHRLICSIVGFKSEASIIKVVEGTHSQVVDFKLKVDVQALETVVVGGKRDKQWKRHYQQFIKYFLGTDEYNFHAKCIIENPYVLEFEEISGNLVAKASKPLIIKNPSLGYGINYELSNFLLNRISGAVTYAGYIFFEEMNPPSLEKANRWEKNRKKSYLGSKMHFLRALASNQLDEEGFELYNERIPFEKLRLEQTSNKRQTQATSIIKKKDNTTSLLYFPGFMRVEYRHKQREVYDNKLRHRVNETSWLKLQIQNTSLDHQGFLLRPMDVWFYEAMGIEGISRQLPTNYDPGEELIPVDTKQVFSNNLDTYDSLCQKEYVVLDFEKDIELIPGGNLAFDAYLFFGKFFQLGSKSRVLYVELIGPGCELVSNAKIDISQGRATGRLNIPSTLYSGTYEIRAFTQWMKNFDPQGFFSYKLYLASQPRQLEASSIKFNPEYGRVFRKDKNNIEVRTLDETSQGVPSYVRIFNNEDELVVDFTTNTQGYHLIEDFKAKSDESFYALIDGSKRKWELPVANESSIDLIINEMETGYEVQLTNKDVYAEFTLIVESYGLISSLERVVLDKKEQFTFFIEKEKLRHGINDISIMDEKYSLLQQKRIFHQTEAMTTFSAGFIQSKPSVQDYVFADAELSFVVNEAHKPLDYTTIFNAKFSPPTLDFENGFQISGTVTPAPGINRNKSKAENVKLQLLIKSNPPQVFVTNVENDGRFTFDDVLFNDTTDVVVEYDDRKAIDFEIEFDSATYLYNPKGIQNCNGSEANIQYLSLGNEIKSVEGATRLSTVEITARRDKPENIERERVYGNPDWSLDLDNSKRPAMRGGILEYLAGRVPNGQIQRDEYAVPTGFVLRGASSYLSDNSAIFIFNGVTITARDFNSLDPYSIGRIDVLSGPAAAAFGSRGAMGVVIAYAREGGERISNRTTVKTFNLIGGFDVHAFDSGN